MVNVWNQSSARGVDEIERLCGERLKDRRPLAGPDFGKRGLNTPLPITIRHCTVAHGTPPAGSRTGYRAVDKGGRLYLPYTVGGARQ